MKQWPGRIKLLLSLVVLFIAINLGWIAVESLIGRMQRRQVVNEQYTACIKDWPKADRYCRYKAEWLLETLENHK